MDRSQLRHVRLLPSPAILRLVAIQGQHDAAFASCCGDIEWRRDGDKQVNASNVSTNGKVMSWVKFGKVKS